MLTSTYTNAQEETITIDEEDYFDDAPDMGLMNFKVFYVVI